MHEQMSTSEPAAAARLPYKGERLRTTIDGAEKFCTRCHEWWPADDEFFTPNKTGAGGLFYCCRACYLERKAELRARKVEVSHDA